MSKVAKNKRKNDENECEPSSKDDVPIKKYLRKSDPSGPLGQISKKENIMELKPAKPPAMSTKKVITPKAIVSKDSSKGVSKGTSKGTSKVVSKVISKAAPKEKKKSVKKPSEAELIAEVTKLRQENEQLKNDQTELLHENASETAEHRALQKNYQTLMQEYDRMKEEHQGQVESLQKEADRVPILEASINDLNVNINQLNAKLDQQTQMIESLEDVVIKAEETRRVMHNTIQDLRGNIRVFCRVRPVLVAEQAKIDEDAIKHSEMTGPSPKNAKFNSSRKSLSSSSLSSTRRDSLTVSNRRSSLSSLSSQSSFTAPPNPIAIKVMNDPEQRKMNVINGDGASPQEFAYDRVISPQEGQDAVFKEMEDLIQSVTDGYNVSIFAYGQTGSGKTWTMEGNSETPENYGVIQKSVSKLFQVQAKMEQSGWVFENSVSELEIHNESVNDLLAIDSKEGLSVKTLPKDCIQHVGSETKVKELTIHNVNDVASILSLISSAQSSRSVAETRMNVSSSRSHSVFMLSVKGTHEKSGQVRNGKLVLIDLAGSERIDKSGVVGKQLEEAKSINKSLSSLSNVIEAISKKQAHVPYRNSTLTYLLQNCLGGESKCLMMVNVSPLMAHSNETISSLRFAQKVNACEVGVAKKNGENSKK